MTQKNQDTEISNRADNLTDSANAEFYIGWQAAAPGSYKRHIRRTVIVLVVGCIVVGTLAALYQRQFSTGVFEFGRLTQVEGVYLHTPIPRIKIFQSSD